jgi:hypothetical protein
MWRTIIIRKWVNNIFHDFFLISYLINHFNKRVFFLIFFIVRKTVDKNQLLILSRI